MATAPVYPGSVFSLADTNATASNAEVTLSADCQISSVHANTSSATQIGVYVTVGSDKVNVAYLIVSGASALGLTLDRTGEDVTASSWVQTGGLTVDCIGGGFPRYLPSGAKIGIDIVGGPATCSILVCGMTLT